MSSQQLNHDSASTSCASQTYHQNYVPQQYGSPSMAISPSQLAISQNGQASYNYTVRPLSVMTPPINKTVQEQHMAPLTTTIIQSPYSQQLAMPLRQPITQMYTPQPMIADDNYLADSSLSAAMAAGKKVKKAQFPPASKETLEYYRKKAKEGGLQESFELAKFLLEAAKQIRIDDHQQDIKKAKKAKEALNIEAQKILKKLATHSGMGKQGYPEAQYFLANAYAVGSIGLSVDLTKAAELYVQGSKQNHPGCTYRAAVCYEVGAGTKKDKNHAMMFFRKAANLGEVSAMYKLGVILIKGLLGQPKNPPEGISWLKRAVQEANEDHPYALHELGLAYEREGIPSVIADLNYARELFSQAAQYGYAPSQFRLGLAYENGLLNCPIDPRRSIAWYSKAAEQSDSEAELALSCWYLTGAEGVLAQNYTEAYLWARKAADRGYAKAEYAVGHYTEYGVGTKPNLEEARRWYMRAAAQNYRKAMQRLSELNKRSDKK
ncbi:hypothetical protein BDF20DRAFT_886117 [Mycotypha africana]|uniref:uncharacterized protein n=1 Tax=Mycotypha africana TaxID=64632 RepID=UPI0022FFF92F|nr:uncharacterized protein BDF20DRAFT_886117 [Mycotypha africana]KAI8971736.1 hypothetical protein BDF20DRAFT_886117 [Mycotypha africana]